MEDAADWQNVEDLVDREVLPLLSFLLLRAWGLIEFVLFVKDGCVFEEAPFVSDVHLGDVGQHQVLLLAGVVEDASEVDLWRQDLQVREADLSLEEHDVLVRVAFVGNSKLSVDVIRHSVLLHAWVELDLNFILSVFLKSHLLDFAVERWFNLQAEGSLERSSVLDGQLLGDRLNLSVLFPEIFELELGLVELQGWSDEGTEDVRVKYGFGLPITADDYLALPGLRDLANLERVCSEFNHDSHLRVESDLIGHDGEDKLLFFLLFFLAWESYGFRGLLLGFFSFGLLSTLLFLFHLLLSGPDDLHRLPASILKEELPWNIFVGVFGAEVDVSEVFFAV